MTRANIKIISVSGNMDLQCNSSAYPSEMMEPILKFVISSYSENKGARNKFYPEPDPEALATLISDAYLTIGKVRGKYYYEIDFDKQTVKVWKSTYYWRNAPKDWKEKGWQGVYPRETTGRMGFSDTKKGKLLYYNSFYDVVEVETVQPKKVVTVKHKELDLALNLDI